MLSPPFQIRRFGTALIDKGNIFGEFLWRVFRRGVFRVWRRYPAENSPFALLYFIIFVYYLRRFRNAGPEDANICFREVL
jgi:hypothetical protein